MFTVPGRSENMTCHMLGGKVEITLQELSCTFHCHSRRAINETSVSRVAVDNLWTTIGRI